MKRWGTPELTLLTVAGDATLGQTGTKVENSGADDTNNAGKRFSPA